MKISIYFLSLSIIATTCLDVFAQMVTRGPYLQNPTSASIVVMWRTDSTDIGKVKYGTDLSNLDNEVNESWATMNHSVKLTGLQPFTKYFYSIGNDTQTLSGPDSAHHFITSPVPGTEQPIRVWAIGDFGKNNTPQRLVRDSYVDYTTDHHTDVWLWLGDNTYDTGTDTEYQDKVFDSINAYHEVMKYIPFMPCPGNHDYGEVCPLDINTLSPCVQDPITHSGPYVDMIDVPTTGEAGGVPSNSKLYFSFDYGNVRFISLNSELGSSVPEYNYIGADFNSLIPAIPGSAADAENSPMMQWLKADLEDAKAKKRDWIIAYWHQVPHSKGSHDSDNFWELYMKAMRENYTPVLEEYGVDLIICGHSHVYERSYLMKGHYGTSGMWDASTMLIDGSSGNDDKGEPYVKKTYGPKANEGTVYLTVGNSGNNEGDPYFEEDSLDFMYFWYGGSNEVGSMILDIHGKRLDAKYLKYDGTIIDEFTMLKEDSATSVNEISGNIFDLKVAPNPFQENAIITYTLDNQYNISIKAYDLGGKQVAKLFEGMQSPGKHTFILDGNTLGQERGVYIIRMEHGEQIFSEKVVKFR